MEGTVIERRGITKKPFGGISSETLRIIAMVFMILDHLWARIIPGNDWMTYLGRIAFPIFAFLISEGFVHTRNFKKYLIRLFVFALVSEIPFNLFCHSSFFYPFHQNVLFTLALGLIAINFIDKLRKNPSPKAFFKTAGLLILLLAISFLGVVDYGATGFLTVIMFYLFRDFPFAWLCRLVAMILMYIVFFEGQTIPFEIAGHSFEFSVQGFAVLSLIPIELYNGKRGKKNKILQYSFYAFYPVHMLIFYLIIYFA